MKHIPLLAALLACLPLSQLAGAQGAVPPRTEQGNLVFDGVPLDAVNAPSALPRWLESRSASFVDWLADGSMVIATRFGNTTQLHRVRAAAGMREQFTFESEPVTAAVAQPYDATQLLFLKDVGGNEQRQIWLRDLATGNDRLLTDGKSRYDTPVFAHDGKRIAFGGNQRDAASNDLYVRELDGEALPRLLLAGGSDDLYVQDWSLDDRRLAVIRYRSSTDSELLLVDVGSGLQTRIEPAASGTRARNAIAAPVSVAGARFSRDGRGLYFLSDRGGEFIGLHYVDLYTNVATDLTPGNRWNIERLELGSDGRYLAYTRNEAGVDRVVVRDLLLKADLLPPPLPEGAVISGIGFDRTGRQLAATIETAAAPADVQVYSIGNELDANGLAKVSLARWTQSELGPIDRSKLVNARLVEFPTWDRAANGTRLISAFVMQPVTPGPHPVFIDIHGGPESQARPSFNAFRQFLVNELGYAVITPNVRGSSGYGRSFLKLDDGALREDSVRDIGALLVWLGVQKEFDRNRVVVAGGSYGGYMTLASMVHYGDRLAGGIDTVGISNFVTFLTNTSPYRRDLRRVEYGDERNPEMRAVLQAISPLTNASRIRKPLLVVQGLNDPRVPASESEQMMRMVRAQGGEVWYLAAKDEGHGFRKKANVDVYRATMVAFLKKLAAR